MPPVNLDTQGRNRLHACFAQSGIERIDGVAGLSQVLLTPASGEGADRVYIVPEDYLAVARTVTLFGLRHEMSFISGLCENDRIDAAAERLKSPHGLQGLLDLLTTFSSHQSVDSPSEG